MRKLVICMLEVGELDDDRVVNLQRKVEVKKKGKIVKGKMKKEGNILFF